jgi:hypothetical protein
MSSAIYVHQECVEHEHGYVLPGRECECSVINGDVGLLLEGTCIRDGQCDVEMSGGMYHDPDWGCV